MLTLEEPQDGGELEGDGHAPDLAVVDVDDLDLSLRETIAFRLADLGAVYIHAGVDAGADDDDETREGRVRRFHEDDNCWIMVANPAAAGEGISLHLVCHNAIYMDRTYNAAHYLQSEDRIHRLGTDVAPVIEIIECADSIDQSVRIRLDAKALQMAAALNDPSITITPRLVDFDERADRILMRIRRSA